MEKYSRSNAGRVTLLVTVLVALFIFATFSAQAGTTAPPQVLAREFSSIHGTLVNATDVSAWSVPSPDPSGVAYWPATGHLLVADAEVEKVPVYAGKNIYESALGGALLNTFSVFGFTNEPTGISVNPTNNHIFISDDVKHKVFEVNLGPDNLFRTGDDTVTSFSTTAFNDSDPEDVVYAGGKLYVLDGLNSEVYIVDPGPGGTFNGVPPTGDDIVTHFDTAGLGQPDPEGITYNSDSGNLYLVSNADSADLSEVTTSGELVQIIDLSFVDPIAIAGIAYAPSSTNPAENHLYLVDRGIDNNQDPNENDGMMYEISLDSGPATNLIANGGFESDNNHDNKPDNWSAANQFTRNTALSHNGSASGRHFATDNSSYSVSQTITNLTQLTPFQFNSWVNIPATSDAFTLKLNIHWRDASNTIIRTDTVKKYTAQTNNWDQTTVTLTSPLGAANALVTMGITSLNATIYVDDFSLKQVDPPTPPPPPTFTDTPTNTPTFTPTVPPFNLLVNPGFENAGSNNRPDNWTSSSKFLRSNEVVHSENFAGKLVATDDSSFSISQVVNATAGSPYGFSGWVNIPATGDAFTFSLRVKWQNSTGGTISTSTFKTYSGATAGWDYATANLTAPAGALSAKMLLDITSLNANIFVDDFYFTAGAVPPPAPTNTPTFTTTWTDTATNTPTDTPTNTPTETVTDTPTNTPTDTPTNTPINTPTDTPTDTPTNTPTDTPTETPTETPTNTPTYTPTDTPTNTPTDTPTETVTDTPTNTPTDTPTYTPSPTPTITPTVGCPTLTPEAVYVEPVTSPTNLLTQDISVAVGGATQYTVETESGVFSNSTSPVTISLLPDTTHHLRVSAHVEYGQGCSYSISTTVDRNNAPLTIVQQSSTPTPTPTSTPTDTPVPPPPTNLLANPGFEVDADNNNKPDSWGTSPKFKKSNEVVHGGSFAGRHSDTTDSDYTINQTVGGVSAGTTYHLSSWVNIPPTGDSFSFKVQVRWQSAGNANIRTDTIKHYTGPTNDWEQADSALVAPAGATSALIRLNVSSLNATIYVDDMYFGQ